MMRLKHIYVFDEDIDIYDDRQVDWAMGTRFQADQNMVILQGMLGMTMDPSLNGRRTGAKSGFDRTRPAKWPARSTNSARPASSAATAVIICKPQHPA
jgi:2,5-furandicarboxylate decarboxylase 1